MIIKVILILRASFMVWK